MARAFLRLYSTVPSVRGWRGAPLLVLAAVILIAVPQARVLLTAGLLGGVVIGASLIIARHQFRSQGPRRGTPIVLFPRPVNASPTGA